MGCFCASRPCRICCRRARRKRNSGSTRPSRTQRRRSRKGAMPCRNYGPPPPKGTISLWRSARWEQNSRPTAAVSDRHSTLPSKARRESSIRFFVTRSTRLLRKPSECLPARACRTGRGRPPLRRRAIPLARARRWQGDRSGGARQPRSGGTLRPARHAGTCCPDRREAGGVERSGRRDGGGAAPSCAHRVRDIPEALLVVTAVCLQGAGIRYKTTALEFAIGLIHGPAVLHHKIHWHGHGTLHYSFHPSAPWRRGYR